MMSKLFFLFRIRLLCLFPIPILLSSLLFLECSPRAAAPDNKEAVNTTTAGSAPVTTAVTPKKLERYHYWGNYRLERNGDSYQLDTTIGECRYEMKEIQTGTLCLFRRALQEEDYDRFPNNFIALEFYDTVTHQLKKVIDLDKVNPFLQKKYKNLQIGGGLDYESMELYGPDAHCNWPKLPKPDRYITNNEVHTDNYSDYLFVNFTLIHLAGRNVVGWEYVVSIFNASGEQIASHKVDKEVIGGAVSQHGRYFCYATRRTEYSSPDPWNDCMNRFVIFDLTNNKIAFSAEYGDRTIISPQMKKSSDDFCYTVRTSNNVILFLLDETNKTVSEYQIPIENWERSITKKTTSEIVKSEKPTKKHQLLI